MPYKEHESKMYSTPDFFLWFWWLGFIVRTNYSTV